MSDFNKTRPLRGVLRVFFQHWKLMLFILVAGTVGPLAYCLFVADRVYESKVTLTTSGSAAAQREILVSDLVLARTIAIVEVDSLGKQWRRIMEASKANPKPEQGDARVRDFINEIEADHVAGIMTNRQNEIQSLRDSVRVEEHSTDGQSGILTVIVSRAGRPNQQNVWRQANEYADTLADMYLLRQDELQTQTRGPISGIARESLDAAENTLSERQQKFDVFAAANAADVGDLEQILSTGGEQRSLIADEKMRENDANLNIGLNRDRALYKAVTRAIPAKVFEAGGIASMSDAEVSDSLDNVSDELFTSTRNLKKRADALAQLEAQKARLQSQFQDAAYEVRSIRNEIFEAKRHLLASVVSTIKGLAVSIEVREQQLAMNQELLSARAKEQSELNAKVARYARLKNELQAAQQHFDDLSKQNLAAPAVVVAAPVIRKIDFASMPVANAPARPKTWIYVATGFGISVLLVVLLMILFRVTDHTMHLSVEAEQYVGLPVVGSIKRHGHSLVEAA